MTGLWGAHSTTTCADLRRIAGDIRAEQSLSLVPGAVDPAQAQVLRLGDTAGNRLSKPAHCAGYCYIDHL